jgi:inosine-uridine nucleoside N-ribohydrolase
MAVLLEADIVLDATEHYVQVERTGSLTRGMTVVDWFSHSKKEPNTRIIRKVDSKRFYELLKLTYE